MKKPIQYLLVGFPYSGKTTLAKELEGKFGFARINVDELKFKKGYRDEGDDDVPDKVWNEIFEEADKLIEQYLREGKNLANEYAWITKGWRDRAEAVAEKAGFETKIIYLDVPKEIILERWKNNENAKTRFQWPENEFKRYLEEFEELSSDENYVVYDQTIPADQWIKTNLL